MHIFHLMNWAYISVSSCTVFACGFPYADFYLSCLRHLGSVFVSSFVGSFWVICILNVRFISIGVSVAVELGSEQCFTMVMRISVCLWIDDLSHSCSMQGSAWASALTPRRSTTCLGCASACSLIAVKVVSTPPKTVALTARWEPTTVVKRGIHDQLLHLGTRCEQRWHKFLCHSMEF